MRSSNGVVVRPEGVGKARARREEVSRRRPNLHAAANHPSQTKSPPQDRRKQAESNPETWKSCAMRFSNASAG